VGRFTSYNSNEKISGLGANETVLELELVCRFFHSDELDAADDGTQGQFDFFQGEAHANAVARTHTESHEGVRIEIGLILRCPSVKRFLFNLDIPDRVLKTVLTGRGRTFRARGSIPRNNEEQRQGR